jgi:hypothetical protein
MIFSFSSNLTVAFLILGGVVNAESSSDGVVGLVKTVIANDEVKAIGNAILEGVPAIMSALETLTEIHPFLKGAFHYFLEFLS